MEKKLNSYLEIMSLFEADVKGKGKLVAFERGHGIAGYIVSGCTPAEVHRLLGMVNPCKRFELWRSLFKGKVLADGTVCGREPRRLTPHNIDTHWGRQLVDKLVAGRL
jgi:hypothetical protein